MTVEHGIYSLGIWLAEFLFIYPVLRSFNLNLSIFAPAFLSIMLRLGMLIPSSPGYVGTYQLMCVIAPAPFGVTRETALSISIVLQMYILSMTTIIGMFCLWRENLKLNPNRRHENC